ncbi:hypothetical protein RWE15_22035 [Virgibacillus halophilus]|uniref:Uncharacterized protein n=1 Tax=Tigheibacillus halophilus TaxID=361280 RepID=A0ABU5CB10_9BACI|nr:hypothetical protein [Virgibacillus halophilus]
MTDIKKIVAEQHDLFATGKTLAHPFRMEQLKKIKDDVERKRRSAVPGVTERFEQITPGITDNRNRFSLC